MAGDDVIPMDFITNRLDIPGSDPDEEIALLLRDEVAAAAGRYRVEAKRRDEPEGVFAEFRFFPLDGAETLGELSRRFEVGKGGPGTISGGVGDPGGKSYGNWQMTSQPKGGTVRRFVDDPSFAFADRFAGLDPGSEAFDTAWKGLAQADAEGFRHAQHAFIMRDYYEPAAARLRQAGLDVRTRSHTLRDVLWSTAVQHGPGNGVAIFGIALAAAGAGPDDEPLIRAVYAERGRVGPDGKLIRFKSSSPAVQKGVAERFVNELRDALAMLAKEKQAVPVPPPPAATAAALAAAGEPAWFTVARGEIGQKEKQGASDNPRIREYFTWTSLGEQPDSVPWCGAFISFCFGKGGALRKGEGSARAADWLLWGRALDQPVRGCLVVLEAQAKGASGHVGFLDSLSDSEVRLLGGNQADAVNVTTFRRGEVRKFGFRWPN
ncbi:TIGR02594 family protein [Roseomonas sp. HJA6]|uniref:TIGR02594 family protein n=1 Tax=Roseomonas alba TaxID=2846776 RepID=A0ABS7A3Y3_9PROT|nr:TIGR02594 family protein [Neoroseomonas alba]MBW6397003.1 TIGR02594 family protein [Neoroseomonas alba]